MRSIRDSKFCEECGLELIEEKVGAETVEACYGMDCIKPYPKYNERTGERQFGIRKRCPKARWYNHHTDFKIF